MHDCDDLIAPMRKEQGVTSSGGSMPSCYISGRVTGVTLFFRLFDAITFVQLWNFVLLKLLISCKYDIIDVFVVFSDIYNLCVSVCCHVFVIFYW